MWSDTGNEQYHSRGDVEKRVNLDAFNFQGPSPSHLRSAGKQSLMVHSSHSKAGSSRQLEGGQSTVSSDL